MYKRQVLTALRLILGLVSATWIVPQIVLALRGSGGVAEEGAMVPLWLRPCTRALSKHQFLHGLVRVTLVSSRRNGPF